MSTKVKFPCIVFLKHRTLDFINYEVYLESESDDC